MTKPRKLAAITAVDVVRYSRLMGEDEAGKARVVRAHREAALPKLAGLGDPDRRAFVLGSAICWLVSADVSAADKTDLPQKGDRLVVDDGANAGRLATTETITSAIGLVSAVPVDASGKRKTNSRFSKILLLRFAPDEIAQDYRADTVDGIIALSAICTHQGCTLASYLPDQKRLVCVCHGSEFLPVEGGEVAHGPARKRLPVLPITKADDGALIVAGEFIGKPGPPAPT